MMDNDAGLARAPVEWNAAVYHRISGPQFAWGLAVLDRLALRGDEVAMDAGCGSGRLTAELCARLPRGRVIAVDRSRNMVDEARRLLAPRFGDRVAFRVADLQTLPAEEPVDLVFSTATFHWVHDHPLLFRHLRASLRPGGALVAQCGGAGNLDVFHGRALELSASPRFRRYFEGWSDPWEFATAEVTAARLRDAGFDEIETELVPALTPFEGADAFKTFLETVVLRPHLARIPDEGDAAAFTAALVERAARDAPAFALDYVRLNMKARRATAA